MKTNLGILAFAALYLLSAWGVWVVLDTSQGTVKLSKYEYILRHWQKKGFRFMTLDSAMAELQDPDISSNIIVVRHDCRPDNIKEIEAFAEVEERILNANCTYFVKLGLDTGKSYKEQHSQQQYTDFINALKLNGFYIQPHVALFENLRKGCSGSKIDTLHGLEHALALRSIDGYTVRRVNEENISILNKQVVLCIEHLKERFELMYSVPVDYLSVGGSMGSNTSLKAVHVLNQKSLNTQLGPIEVHHPRILAKLNYINAGITPLEELAELKPGNYQINFHPNFYKKFR